MFFFEPTTLLPRSPQAMPLQPVGELVGTGSKPGMGSKLGPVSPKPLRRTVVWGVAVVLLIRALIFASGWISATTAKPGDINSIYASGSPWMAYDSAYYYHILLYGYPKAGPGGVVPSHVAFFPLYPVAARLLLGVVSPFTAMLIVSNLCALIGLLLIYLWARTMVEPGIAFLAVLLASACPDAVFFCAGYTEGPFLMLCCLALLLLAKERPLEAAGVCGLAGLLRPTAAGLIVTIVLWVLVYGRRAQLDRRLVRAAMLGVIAATGAIAYDAYSWGRYDRWDAYFAAQHHWSREAMNDKSEIPQSFYRLDAMDLGGGAGTSVGEKGQAGVDTTANTGADTATNTATDMGAGAPVMGWMEKIRTAPQRLTAISVLNYAIAAAIAVILGVALIFPGPMPRVVMALPLVIFLITVGPDHGSRFGSLGRYELVAPPLFLIAAYWMWRRVPRVAIRVLVALCVAAQVYYAWRFSRGLWVG